MEQFFSYNGKLFPTGTPVFSPSSPAFRFGDSLFETIRINHGQLMLFDLHVERLFKGIRALGFDLPGLFTKEFLESAIVNLARKNCVLDYGRVRLTVFRKEGGVSDPISSLPDWIIECSALADQYLRLNEIGYSIDIASNNKKGTGPLSNIKTGNYIIYILAAQIAKERKLNECLVLNNAGRIADSSIFNIFLIRDGILSTPSLDEAPVAGVMRNHLINHFHQVGNPVQEKPVTIEDLESADEVFLTNALYGIRWVKSFRSTTYSNTTTRLIYSDLFKENIPEID